MFQFSNSSILPFDQKLKTSILKFIIGLFKWTSILACSGVKGAPALATINEFLSSNEPLTISTASPSFLRCSIIDGLKSNEPGFKTTDSSATVPAFANSG